MAKGEDTRRAILAEALSLASEVGLDGLSIGLLAERVGMSKSGLFAHFGSKEDLQLAVLDEATSRFVDVVVSPALREPRGLPRVRALFDRWLSWTDQPFLPGGCVFVHASVELDDKAGPARDKLVASQKDWLETLAHAARIAVDEGHFRKDLDVHQLAFEAFSIAYGFHFLDRLLRDPRAEERARAAFERLVDDAAAAR
ncbi:TetR/AcrR family transcriptional regulator [Sorangium sp. So ce134]